jgi:hypothetical protein
MTLYTVCHKHNGYIQHSYILANNKVKAWLVACSQYKNILSIMENMI